jgi:integral membrane sensor domain MASE1
VASLCQGKQIANYGRRGGRRRHSLLSGSPTWAGLALSDPSDVAVFWPASGIAAGILIISGRRAYTVLVIGVVVGTVAANIMSDRSLLTALFKGFCNAGEAVMAAWLLERWFARPFRFANLRRVVGFLTAAVLATAASATGGSATMTLLHTAAPYWDVWCVWLLSDWVGIVVVAPLVIGLGEIWREPPSLREWTEGLGVLTISALVGNYTVGHESGSWVSFCPGVLVLPLLLWLTARFRDGWCIHRLCRGDLGYDLWRRPLAMRRCRSWRV